MTATVAYLVLAHEANEQLFRLTNALLADKRSRVYLHLDAKLFDVGWPEFHGDPRLVVLLNRVEVNWNDYSVVEATLALLHRALTDSTNERFVLLSGSCFPLMPIGTLNNDILKSITPMISVCGRIDASLTQDEAPEHDVVAKLRLYDRTVLTIKNHLVHTLVWKNYKRFKPNFKYEKIFDVTDNWKKSQFFIFKREYAEACAYPPAALLKALRFALAPHEILFTTQVVRHAHAGKAHFVFKRARLKLSLPDRLSHPDGLRHFAVPEADDAVASGAMFARKCPAEVSRAIAARWTGDEPIEVHRYGSAA